MYSRLINHIRNEFKSNDFIPLHAPLFIGNEKKYVIDAIDSTFVSSVGEYVDRFEKCVKDYTGAKYAIATVNGTAALHMSLILAGVESNDLVITQSLSFIATCNAIKYLNADPLFLDVDPENLSLSSIALGDFLKTETIQRNGRCFHKQTNKRISACVPMHTFGHPAKIDEIVNICNQFGIAVVEDAAESIGSFYKQKHTGTFGLLGAFSFNGNKTITCGGGGVIITDSEKLGKLGKHLTTQAKIPHRWRFYHDQIGYNYRLPNLNAALACAQMENLELFIAKKRELAMSYFDFFKNSKMVFIKEPEFSRSNYWLNSVLMPSQVEKEEILNILNDSNIMARPIWDLLHTLPMFNNCIKYDLTNSIFIAERLINLPSSVKIEFNG